MHSHQAHLQCLLAGILQLCCAWRTSCLGTGRSCPKLLVNWNKDHSVLLLNMVCQSLSLLLSDQKVFMEKHHQNSKVYYHRNSTSELFYLTAFEQQSYNSRSCIWLLGENPGKFQSLVNHHVNIDTEYQQGK